MQRAGVLREEGPGGGAARRERPGHAGEAPNIMPGQARPFAVSVAVSINQHAAVPNVPPALLWPHSLYQLLTCSELQSGLVRLEQRRTFSLFRGALRAGFVGCVSAVFSAVCLTMYLCLE